MAESAWKIRMAAESDRARIGAIISAAGIFTNDEVASAMDLVDQSFSHPARGDYLVAVVEESGCVWGYVCYGPTPLTDGVYDLYWIAVDPARQRQGFGQFLLRYVESEVRKRGGRMLLIETSSKKSYAPTLRFYTKAGYEEISRIKDFYRVQDDKLVFCKYLTVG